MPIYIFVSSTNPDSNYDPEIVGPFTTEQAAEECLTAAGYMCCRGVWKKATATSH